MTRHAVHFEGSVVVTINDPDVIERVTDPVRGEEWQARFYQLVTVNEVITHLAYNCIANGRERANQLDGWADLPDDAATMALEGVEPTGEVLTEEPTNA